LQLPLADRLVLKNIRAAMGGTKKVLACGGAPLRKEIEEFFLSTGMLLLQGYGLTEASPLCSFNAPDTCRPGTCGRVITGADIKIGENGEILYRGPNVMTGYWNHPEATAATIRDGWLHTGDVGHVDHDGFLVITDRIKDLIITSTGKNVAPGPIESLVLTDPLFEHAVLLGDNRPFLTLLVFPSLPQLESVAKRMQITWQRREELFHHPESIAEIKRRVRTLTSKLPPHEQIKDLRVLINEITQYGSLLTPTLKVKRKEVEKHFAELIEDMYSAIGKKRKGPSASE
jgi:long-chain acyl-CoA synthetase